MPGPGIGSDLGVRPSCGLGIGPGLGSGRSSAEGLLGFFSLSGGTSRPPTDPASLTAVGGADLFPPDGGFESDPSFTFNAPGICFLCLLRR